MFTFRVSDTGIGIAEEEQQRVFKSFEQLGSNYSKSQGTGLGLAISKSIVHLMGGELKLSSRSGEGSEFYFTVTFPKGQLDEGEGKELKEEENLLHGVNILVVEDNELNAEIAIELLNLQGASVMRAENGREAVELFRQSRPGTIHVILMDIQMPVMNGLDAAAAIRELPRDDAATVPIIAMTANAFKQDREAAVKTGMTGFIPKPIDVNVLYEELLHGLKEMDGEGVRC